MIALVPRSHANFHRFPNEMKSQAVQRIYLRSKIPFRTGISRHSGVQYIILHVAVLSERLNGLVNVPGGTHLLADTVRSSGKYALADLFPRNIGSAEQIRY